MRLYGVPYKGSKNAIAGWVVDNLPAGRVLVDLFCGGCAVTHAAMLSGKWCEFVINDINPFGQRLFMDSIAGKYRNEMDWISRETFALLKGSDPYVALCWSFGNNSDDYLYSKEVEPWKKALHFARVKGDRSLFADMGIDTDGSRADIVRHKEEYKRKYIAWYLVTVLQTPENYDNIKRDLERNIERSKEELRAYLCDALKASGLTQAEVQRRLGTQMAGHYFGRSQWEFPTREMYGLMMELMPLKPYDEVYGYQDLLQSLQSLQSDYRKVSIPDGSVIYCDIPYRGTSDYGKGFDHEEFYYWACHQEAPVYISEYSMPEDRFKKVASVKKQSLLAGTGSKTVTEGLFIPKHQKTYQLFDL